VISHAIEPAFNSGHWDDARPCAEHFLRVFGVARESFDGLRLLKMTERIARREGLGGRCALAKVAFAAAP
jgi:hypothetical protein